MTTLGRIIQNQGFYYLIIPKSLAEETVKNLKKYAQFSRIQVQESPGLFFYGLASPTPESFWPKQLNHVAHFSLAGFPLSLCLEEQNSQHTRILCITDQPLDPKITFKDFTLKPEAWWLAQEIQNLTPYLTAETSGKFLPHEINLPNQQGVSFTKGCFLGQEIIARMEHLGKLKKQMACEVIESTEISGSSETKESSENLNEIICQCVYENKTYRLRLLKII
jgi:folate-binding protein YgfZ